MDNFVGWQARVPLETNRLRHSCGVLVGSGPDNGIDNQAKLVVAAGGTDKMALLLSSVETMLVLESDSGEPLFANKWEAGPGLPIAIVDAASATTPDQKALFIFGGGGSIDEDSRSVFVMRCTDVINLQCSWTRLDDKLKMSVSKGLALTLPEVGMIQRGYADARDCVNGNSHNNYKENYWLLKILKLQTFLKTRAFSF